MRTAEICPTCTTFVNSKCIIYDGPLLSNINVAPLDNLNTILSSINTSILPINGTIAPIANAKFVGQLYVNTIEPALYYASAVGNGSGDWNKIVFPAPLGYTPENVANKSTDVTLSANSDTLYPSQRAIKTYADTKQPLLGFAPENVTNKSTDITLGGATPSNIKYPSQKAVKDYVDTVAAFPYKVYSAIVSYNSGGGGFILVSLLQNTLGTTVNLQFSMNATFTSLDPVFTANKTVVIANSYSNGPGNSFNNEGSRSSDNLINLYSIDTNTGNISFLDNIPFFVEIRVYP